MKTTEHTKHNENLNELLSQQNFKANNYLTTIHTALGCVFPTGH